MHPVKRNFVLMARQKCRNNEDIFRAFSAPLSAKTFYRAAFPYLKSALEAAFSLFNGAEIQCGRNLLLFFLERTGFTDVMF